MKRNIFCCAHVRFHILSFAPKNSFQVVSDPELSCSGQFTENCLSYTHVPVTGDQKDVNLLVKQAGRPVWRRISRSLNYLFCTLLPVITVIMLFITTPVLKPC